MVQDSDIQNAKRAMNAIEYIEVSEKQHVAYLFTELAKTTLRSEQYSQPSKIVEIITTFIENNKNSKGENENSLLLLKKMKIQYLPNEFLLCSDFLQNVNLDHNNIKYFPYELLSCIQLSQLSLNSNQIEKIPTSIKKLINLTRFQIESNKLETLPWKEVRKPIKP